MLGQYSVLAYVRVKVQDNRTMSHLTYINIVVTIYQYILIFLLAVTIFQIWSYSHYSTSILSGLTMTSYCLSTITLGILAFRLFRWFSIIKSYIVLAYGLSAAVFALSSLFLMTFLAYTWSNLPDEIQFHHHNLPYFSNPGSPTFITYNGYVILSITSFITIWAATAMVLAQLFESNWEDQVFDPRFTTSGVFSESIHHILSQFVLSMVGSKSSYYAVLLSLVFSLSKAVGGILFGLAFWTMARSLKKPNILKEYLTITAIGFVLVIRL